MVEEASHVTTDAVIVGTRGNAPLYAGHNGALRVTGFTRGQAAPADLAECPRVVDEHGDPLRALVVRSAPIASGAHVQVRPLALLHDLTGSPILVAAPVVDERTPDGAGLDALRSQLERLVGAESGFGRTSWTWSDAHAAATYMQEAVARAMRLHSGRRAVSAWAALTDAAAVGATVAEAQVSRLPARFQDFVREQLDEQERISLFIHRPQSRGRGLFTRAVREALLVVTDQQVLWLEDVRPHVPGVPSYGYDARTMPLERVAAVERASAADGEQIRLCSEAGGPELVLELPAAAARVCADAEEHVRRFIDRRSPLPRRIYAPRRPKEPLIIPEGWPEIEPIARGLFDQLSAEHGTPQVAAFLMPARMRGEARALLALYPDELRFVPVPGERAQPESYPLADLAWLELRNSLLVAHIRIVGRTERAWTSASSVPIVALFRPLRQLLANASVPVGVR